MIASHLVALAVLLAPPAQPSPARKMTVAVLALEAKPGVAASTADVITEHLADTLRRSDAFSNVVSFKDIQTALGVEQTRQMMNCEANSCLAEMAGALGVDFVAAGTLARIGEAYVINLKLIQTRNGVAAASVSKKLAGSTEEVLFDAIQPAVQQLVMEAGVAGKMGGAARLDHAGGASSPGGSVPAEEAGGPNVVLMGVGGVGLAAGVLAGLVAVVLGGAGVALLVVPRVVGVPTPGLPYEGRVAVLDGGMAGSALLSAVAVVVAVVLVAGGVGGLFMGWKG